MCINEDRGGGTCIHSGYSTTRWVKNEDMVHNSRHTHAHAHVRASARERERTAVSILLCLLLRCYYIHRRHRMAEHETKITGGGSRLVCVTTAAGGGCFHPNPRPYPHPVDDNPLDPGLLQVLLQKIDPGSRPREAFRVRDLGSAMGAFRPPRCRHRGHQGLGATVGTGKAREVGERAAADLVGLYPALPPTATIVS